MADIINSQNPLNDYSDPSKTPTISVDGLSVNTNYAFVGVVDTLAVTNNNSYPSPQTGQNNSQQATVLSAKNIPISNGYTNFPKAKQGDPTILGVQFQLNVPNTSNKTSINQPQQITFLNYISFSFQDVPANWSVWYKNPLTGVMVQLTDINGNYVGGRTLGQVSKPWTFQEIYCQTIGTSLIEIRLDRNIPIITTLSTQNVFQKPYSFGLGNVNFKLLALDDYSQIPETAILASKNALGLTEQYVKIQHDSSQIQSPFNRTSSQSTTIYWKSEPQPVANAVVCLYVDMASQQAIDSMYLDPLYTGVGMNLYYSNDNTINNIFWCSRNQTFFTQKDANNPISFLNVGEQVLGPFGNTRSGAVVQKASNSGLICPGNIQIDGNQSWAMGLQFTPNNLDSGSGTLINQLFYDNSTNPVNTVNTVKLSYAISGKNINFTAIINGISLSTVTVNKMNMPTGGWVSPPYTITFGYDNSTPNQYGNSPPYIYMYVNVSNSLSNNILTSNPVTVSQMTPLYDYATPTSNQNNGYVGNIVLGNSVPGGSPADGVILNFWIRQDSITQSIFNSYKSNSRFFIDSYGPKTSLRGDYKTLLLARLNNVNCYSGPSSEYYEAKTWTPVQSDLQLRKSTYSLPLINARYIKFEFTNLKGENYQLIEGTANYTYKLFPSDVLAYWSNQEEKTNGLKLNNYIGLSTQTAGAPVSNVGLNNLTFATASGNFASRQPPTLGTLVSSQTGSVASYAGGNQQSAVIDPTSSSTLLSHLTGSQQNDNSTIPYLIPKFTQTSVHNYNFQTIKQTWNKAYFVGLKALQFYKRNQSCVDDTEYYYDACINPPGTITSLSNTSIFDSTGATFPFNENVMENEVSNGYLATASGQYIYTLPLTSFSPVSSFQLAANCSDWVSLIPQDQALMTNNNTSYITTNNCQTLQPITNSLLTSGVWQISPFYPNQNYGIQTQIINNLPTSISDSIGMRISAAVRFYLPTSSNGTYQLNFYATIDGIQTLIGSKSINAQTMVWTDLEVVFSIPSIASAIGNFYATFTQTNSQINEPVYVTMFSMFYNPISFAWTFDKTNFFSITSTINDPKGYNSLSASNSYFANANNFFVRVKAHNSGAQLNSILIAPQYPFNAYTPNANIDYYPDPRTNEVLSKVPVFNQPMFQLPNNFIPASYSLQNTSYATQIP